jgi:hypothetical protein
MGCLLPGMTCCWVWHDGDRLVGHLGSTRAAIVLEPDAVAADCFNTRRAILLKHSVRRLANAGSTSTLTPGTPAGGAPGRWPIACCAPASSTPRLLGQRRQPSDHQAKLPVGRELSDLLGRQALGPHGQDGHAGAGRAALEQAPRRVGRHLRGRDHLSLLSDSSTTLDVNSPFVPAEGPAACGAADVSPTGRGRGHRKLVRWTRPGTL